MDPLGAVCASIRRLWALRTKRKTIERDVCAPVVLAHQHFVALSLIQRDPERRNHSHKSRGIDYKPLRSEDEPVLGQPKRGSRPAACTK